MPDLRPPIAVTVAICTRNHRESLLEVLDSLRRPQWRATPDARESGWEVLVVDNGSEDGTAEAALGQRADFPVPLRVEREPRAGLSFARNHALEAARGEALVFIDDDVTCMPGWLAGHARALADPSVAGTAGRILPRLPESTPDWFREALADEIGGPTSRYDFGDEGGPIDGRTIELPFGANMGLRRALALELGGFRTDLGWGKEMIPGEETELFRRVLASGGKLVYVPEAILEHRIEASRVTMDYFLRWQRGFGRAKVLLDPPQGKVQHARHVVKAALKLARWDLRARWRHARASRPLELEAVRKRARAQGRLYQLLGR